MIRVGAYLLIVALILVSGLLGFLFVGPLYQGRYRAVTKRTKEHRHSRVRSDGDRGGPYEQQRENRT